MNPIIPVAAGSALGGVARYAASVMLASHSTRFPVATLLINVAGSFVLGVLMRGFGEAPARTLQFFLAVGFCGGFTTFSTFSLETARLIQAGAHGRAALYITASVALSIAGVLLGLAAGRLLVRSAV